MLYTWYKIFNLVEFQATTLVSRALEYELIGQGVKSILITQGVGTSILYEGVLLMLNLNGESPFAFDGYAIYKDQNDDVWLGIEVDAD